MSDKQIVVWNTCESNDLIAPSVSLKKSCKLKIYKYDFFFQSRADELAEARAADTESSADRAAREAVVRRLDNERQYLKSQLQSEITCKDELREALATATRQLGDIKVRRLGGGGVCCVHHIL